MVSARLKGGRLPPLFRLLRFPKTLHRPPNLRLFTQNSRRLLISPPSSRPQLPFLYSSANTSLFPTLSRNRFPLQLARLLTTERKTYLKQQAWAAVKITTIGWTALALIATILFGIENERLERKFPSPEEWSWMSRWLYRSSRGEEIPEANGTGLVDWARTGQDYRRLLGRLEDINVDGKGIRPSLGADGDIYVAGIGRTGFDITVKSEPWRRGYYECLMGAARAAEHLDTWVRDKTRNIAFPPGVIIGPSNPRPNPVPYGAKKAPREEDCEPAFDSPEHYYMKILTTSGFHSRQRLHAALAYADWLEYKGLPSSAEGMYDWALDIAIRALPTDASEVIDTRTGVLNEDASHITPNILLATTALARHHAQTQNLSVALPIFLSILRAQRNLPAPSAPIQLPRGTDSSDSDPSMLSLFASFARSLLIAPSYPDAPPSGDLPATRSVITSCEEAATMSHVGEVLFASSTKPSGTLSIPPSLFPAKTQATSSQSSGLAWTRESVALAEQTLLSLSAPSTKSSPSSLRPPRSLSSRGTSREVATARQRCIECLLSSMENWKLMVAQLQQQEAAKRAGSAFSPQRGSKAQRGWFWSGSNTEGENDGTWEREAQMVEMKSREIAALVKEDGWTAQMETGRGVLGFA
ncbi:hypothetical protein MMC13_003234 [Lambiella insularis]|nr:hypothetical protein [Lambiella insularis]